jgi:tetratricopeptide (TPR) repeat protein
VSCLVEQAKILFGEAEYNNLGTKVLTERFQRWDTCSLCEQDYHGVVRCALAWACWKTYVGRPEEHWTRRMAMTVLGNGLNDAEQHEAALSVYKAELAMERRLGAPEASLLNTQSNLAMTYAKLGQSEQALQMRQEVYYRILKLHGEEDRDTLIAAGNHASCLLTAKRFDEAKALLRKVIPVARRILGESDVTTLRMRGGYAEALKIDPGATLNDLREAAMTLEDAERIAQRVLGGAHPTTVTIEEELRDVRAALGTRETGLADALADMRV